MPLPLSRTPFGLLHGLLLWGLGSGLWLLTLAVELKFSGALRIDLLDFARQRDGLAAGLSLLLLMICSFLRRRSRDGAPVLAEDGIMVLVVLVFPLEVTVPLLGIAGILESASQQVERHQRGLPVGGWRFVAGEMLFQGGVAAFIGLTGSTVEQAGHLAEWHVAPRFGARELVTIPLIYLSIFVMRASVSFLYLWARGVPLGAFMQETRARQSVVTFLAEFATVALAVMIAVAYAQLGPLPVIALCAVLVAQVALLSKQGEAAERQQRTIAEMKILVGVGRALSNPDQTRRELFRTLCQEGRELFRADSLAVYLFPEDGAAPRALEWQPASAPPPPAERRGAERNLGHSGKWQARSSTSEHEILHPEADALGLAEWCVQHKRALRISDIEREAASYGYRWLTERLPYRSWMGVPLEAEKKTLGVISVASYQARAFSEQDEGMLHALGQQLVGALEKARLHELATVDGLTGLLNARAARAKLAEIFAKTLSANGQMSLIMFDIDYFKKVNDTYGHEVGNEVLKHLAKVARDKLRDTDIAGRYGGEEFIVVLPNTPARSALDVAERLRRYIETRPVPTAAGNLSVTASFGVAALPSPGMTTPDALIEAADKALYVSKRGGRNRVTMASPPGQSVSA
ncbi:MAG: hypothetical protein CFK52_03940 [Chloracidobacterium sp. CP2_5A]|nr:MAG: hypothetical protein CFK52_03940 [Chloracidobacterium sp. CP2_5A]